MEKLISPEIKNRINTQYPKNKISPGTPSRGYFVYVICLLCLAGACKDKPKEVLQYLDDGTVIRRHYEINGKKEGIMTEYYPSGNIKGERTFVNDIQHGKTIWYYPDGTKQEVQMFENGLQTGTDTLWMEDGSLQRVIHFQNGVKHGPMRTWDENGELILEVIFENDEVLKINKSSVLDSSASGNQ